MKGMKQGDTSMDGQMFRQGGDGSHDTVVGDRAMPWSGHPGSERMARNGDGAKDTMMPCNKGKKPKM